MDRAPQRYRGFKRCVVALALAQGGVVAATEASTQQHGLSTCDPSASRVDCSQAGVDKQGCEALGCCWAPLTPNPSNLPWCFKPMGPSPPPPPSKASCFALLDQPLLVPLFDDAAITKLHSNFFANINVNGTGAVIASPGAVPALQGCCPGGYSYHWMRDGALTMDALQRLDGFDPAAVKAAMRSYVKWVSAMQARASPAADAHTEPKWVISTGQPYAAGWCRPQTDGPGLRARALMRYAGAITPSDDPERVAVWGLIKYDLDWLAQGDPTVGLNGCDLWEETTDPNFLWNRVTQRRALVWGQHFADEMGDDARSAGYAKAAAAGDLEDPVADHTAPGGGFITECPAAGGGASCQKYGKQVDGAVILSLVHSGWLDPPANVTAPDPVLLSPTAVSVANTVAEYNTVFCDNYPINIADSKAGVPGIMYGRYAADTYGGGNPWQLISAALATLLYQASQACAAHAPTQAEAAAWRLALGSLFRAEPDAFIAAGDAVLSRIHHHIVTDDNAELHVYEQIDRVTGVQYNAQDLTWSYAELLIALTERKAAIKAAGRR